MARKVASKRCASAIGGQSCLSAATYAPSRSDNSSCAFHRSQRVLRVEYVKTSSLADNGRPATPA